MKVSLKLLAEQANALAKHHAGCGEDWYEGLMNFLCALEYNLQRNDEVLIEREELDGSSHQD